MTKEGYVYILASKKNGVLYVGVTYDLVKRASQHRLGTTGGFTSRYHVKKLVYYAWCGSMEGAIAREKELKKWRRAWKIALIEKENPAWDDLFLSL